MVCGYYFFAEIHRKCTSRIWEKDDGNWIQCKKFRFLSLANHLFRSFKKLAKILSYIARVRFICLASFPIRQVGVIIFLNSLKFFNLLKFISSSNLSLSLSLSVSFKHPWHNFIRAKTLANIHDIFYSTQRPNTFYARISNLIRETPDRTLLIPSFVQST